jgi:hypothetical protein
MVGNFDPQSSSNRLVVFIGPGSIIINGVQTFYNFNENDTNANPGNGVYLNVAAFAENFIYIDPITLQITVGQAGFPVSCYPIAIAYTNNQAVTQLVDARIDPVMVTELGGGSFAGVAISGNTSGVTAPIIAGVLTLAGGPNITLSQAGNAVTISGAAGGGGIVSLTALGNTTSSSAGSFSNL